MFLSPLGPKSSLHPLWVLWQSTFRSLEYCSSGCAVWLVTSNLRFLTDCLCLSPIGIGHYQVSGERLLTFHCGDSSVHWNFDQFQPSGSHSPHVTWHIDLVICNLTRDVVWGKKSTKCRDIALPEKTCGARLKVQRSVHFVACTEVMWPHCKLNIMEAICISVCLHGTFRYVKLTM